MAASAERRRAEYLGVLGLEPGATLSEIKSAYKRQALQCHPDKNQNDPEATKKFQEVSEAYNSLIRAEGEDDDDDFDGFCENDDVLIHLLNMFMEMRQRRAYEERLFRRSRSNVRLVFTPFGPMLVEDESEDEYYDNDYYEPPYRGGYESRSMYNRASHSRTRVPNPAPTSRPTYEHNYPHMSQDSQRINEKKPNVNHDTNHYRDSSEDRPTVNHERKPAKKKKKPEPKPAPEPPKKLTKKQLLAEQKRREKEMAEIAENLAQQRAEKLEREQRRAEKERLKQQELKNSTGNPGLLRYQKGHDKELENTIKEQLLQSEKEAIEHEKLVKEASKATETKKSKSRRKREAKQRRMKGGGVEKAPEPTCDQSTSKVAELAQMSAEEIHHDEFFLDPAPQILKTTTSFNKPVNISTNSNTNFNRSPNRPSFRGRQFGSPQRNLYTSSSVRNQSPSQARTGYPNYQPRFRSPEFTSAGRGHVYANQRFTAPPSQRRPFVPSPRPKTVSQTHSQQRSKAPTVDSELSSNWPLPSADAPVIPKQSTHAGSKVNDHSSGTENSAPWSKANDHSNGSGTSAPWCFQDKPGFQKPNPPPASQPEPVHNVWAERQSFQSACPKSAEEEEAMLKAALEMSQLEAERSESVDGTRQLIPGVCANPAMRDRVPDPWNLSDISFKDAPPPQSASGYVGMEKLSSISTAAPAASLEPSGGTTSQPNVGNEWQLSCDEDDEDDEEEDEEEEEEDEDDSESGEDCQIEKELVTQPLHPGGQSDTVKNTGLDSPTLQSFRTSSRLPKEQRSQKEFDHSSFFDLSAVRQQVRKTSLDNGKPANTTTDSAGFQQPQYNFSFLQPVTTTQSYQPPASSAGARPKLPTPTAEVAPEVPTAKMESLSLSEDHSEMWDVDSDDDSVGKPGFTPSANLGLGIKPNLASVNPLAGSNVAATKVPAPVRKVSPTENFQDEQAQKQAADATAAAAAASNNALPSIQNLSSFFSLANQAQAQQTLLQQLFPIPGVMPVPQTTGVAAPAATSTTAAADTTTTNTHQGTPQVPLFPSIPPYMPGPMPYTPSLFMPLLGQPNLGAFGAGAVPAGVGGGLGGVAGDTNNSNNNAAAGAPASSDTAGTNSVPSQWNS